MSDDICKMGIAKLAGLLKTGALSASEATKAFLQQIESTDPRVRAYISLDPEGALAAADAADRRLAAGDYSSPLCGVPIALKDVLCSKGLRTTGGSNILKDFVPPYDATVVERLREAGAVILGKTTMDEFAMGSANENSPFAVPNNPWRDGYICGGSSGGSAAATAADLCAASLGTDTGGSIRQPASHCGVVGLKPSYGRVSRYGLLAFASSLDQVGPICKSVEDCAILLQAISGHDPRDSTSMQEPVPDYLAGLAKAGEGGGIAGLRIGLPREYFGVGLQPEVKQAVDKTVAFLRENGAEIVEISLPHTAYGVAAYYVIAPAEASSNLSRYDGVRFGHRAAADELAEMYCRSRSEGFGPEVKRRIIIGTYALSSGYYDAYYRKASQVRALIIEDYRQAFSKCDLILSPVTPSTAWKIGEKSDDPLSMYLSDVLTIPTNLAGLPGLSLPCGFDDKGLPIGVQIQAGHFKEGLILKAAAFLEKALAINELRAKPGN